MRVGLQVGDEKDQSARSISRAPAMFTGRLASETMARIAAMPPTTPGRIAPGVDSSVMIP